MRARIQVVSCLLLGLTGCGSGTMGAEAGDDGAGNTNPNGCATSTCESLHTGTSAIIGPPNWGLGGTTPLAGTGGSAGTGITPPHGSGGASGGTTSTSTGGTSGGAAGSGATGSGATGSGGNGGSATGGTGAGGTNSGGATGGSTSAGGSNNTGGTAAGGNTGSGGSTGSGGFPGTIIDVNGGITITVTVDTGKTFVFHGSASAAVAIQGGLSLTGTVTVDTPSGQLILDAAALTFVYDAGGTHFVDVTGSSLIPLTPIGVLAGATIANDVRGALDIGTNTGLGTCSTIAGAGHYITYTLDAAASMNLRAFGVNAPQGSHYGIDPITGMLYIEGTATGVDPGGLSGGNCIVVELAADATFQGLGLFAQVDFRGGLWVYGSTNITTIGVHTDTSILVDVEPSSPGEGDGPPGGPQITVGISGDISVDVNTACNLPFTLLLVQAKLEARLDTSSQGALGGLLSSGSPFGPESMPLDALGPIHVDGNLEGDVRLWSLSESGPFKLRATALANASLLGLHDVALANATVLMDDKGLHVHGTVDASLCDLVSAVGAVDVDLDLPCDGDWSLTLDGDVGVAGIAKVDASVRISKSGAILL